MNFRYYEERAADTAKYPPWQAIQYLAMGVASEAGEVAGHVKKMLRDDGGTLTPQRIEAIKAELGDVLWYVARMAFELGSSLDEIATLNLMKLESRQDRGVIGGEGDER